MDDNKPVSTEKPRLWTASFIFVCLANLTNYMVFHGTGAVLPIYISEFGEGSLTLFRWVIDLSTPQKIAGFALATLAIGAIIVRPITGWALDKFGRKLMLMCGLLIFIIPSIIYTFMVPVLALIVLRLVHGLGWGVSSTALWTSASDIAPPSRLGEGVGFYSMTLSLSLAMSPPLCLWIINRYDFVAFFQFCILMTIVTFIIGLLIKYPQIEKQASQLKISLFEKTALRPSMTLLFISIAYGAQMSFVVLHALNQGLLSAGFYFTALAIANIIVRPISGMVIDRMGRKGFDLVMLTGCIALLLTFFILGNLNSYLHLLLAGMFFGMGFGLTQPTALSECINSAPASRRGAATATFWTAVDIGMAGGAVGCGVVAVALGYNNMFLLNLIPIIIAMAIYFVRGKSNTADAAPEQTPKSKA